MREKSHRFEEYGDSEGLRMYYQTVNWSAFVQQERDDATIAMGTSSIFGEPKSIADMSAGGAQITPTIANHHGVEPLLGDLGQQYGYRYTGTLQETLPRLPVVDLYICSETLEHLVDPDTDLALIRQHCKNLLLTTPVWEEPHMVSHGHLWTWRIDDVQDMLEKAGFEVMQRLEVSIFGIFACK